MEAPVTSSPSGAICARHPTVSAFTTCTRCGTYICTDCYTLGGDGNYYCFECNERVPDLAERGDRFIANLVDNFILMIPMFGGFLLGAIVSRNEALAGIAILLGVLGSLAVAGYQIYLAQYGQSIGKRMRHIRVIRNDGSPASLARILLLRNFVPAIIGSFCGLFGIVDVLTIFGEERRCLHDLLADTKVVKVNSDTDLG
jgi:uncharacterized RDD family membrane protein YckC